MNLLRPARWCRGDGRITIEMGADYKGQAGVLQMTPMRTGAAMSRALVYFHAPGSWPRMPNFFDPFWGSKLHPFDVTTMGMVLAALDGLKQLTTVEEIARERGVEPSSLGYRSRAKVREAQLG